MSSQGGLSGLLPLALMIVAAWFLLVRPQQKRAKQMSEMLAALTPGVEIVTIGGIFGTIVDLGEDRVRIAVADGSELEIARQAIRSVVDSEEITSEFDEAGEVPSAPAETDPTPADEAKDEA